MKIVIYKDLMFIENNSYYLNYIPNDLVQGQPPTSDDLNAFALR